VSSIKYAERIQKAVLSNEQKFKSILPDSFVFYQPKDIVSGDFYWIERVSTTEKNPKGLIVYATADCTGHGVPGAFVSIICNNLLKLGKTQANVNTPAEALDFTNSEINKILNSEFTEDALRDGMDVALCAIDPTRKVLYFAGAKNGVCIVRKGELIEFKGDRKAIGYQERQTDIPFTNHTIPLEPGDMIYTFSDGYMDQFGGPESKKYSSRRLKELLVAIAEEPLMHQQAVLENSFDIWKDETPQLDDVLVIGVRFT
jgi:serine phosphatase RsbU (regulator of sigma subunit)